MDIVSVRIPARDGQSATATVNRETLVMVYFDRHQQVHNPEGFSLMGQFGCFVAITTSGKTLQFFDNPFEPNDTREAWLALPEAA